MKIKPKKMLAGGFLLRSSLIKSVMKVIGKDNAKVIAAKKSLSTTGKLDQLNLAQQKYERANIFSDTVNALVSKSKTFKNFLVAEEIALPNKPPANIFFGVYFILLIIFFASKSTKVFFEHSASYFSLIF